MSHDGPASKKDEKNGLGKRIAGLFHRKKDDDKVTSAQQPAKIDVRAVDSPSAVLPSLPSEPLPPVPACSQEPLPAPSQVRYDLHADVVKAKKDKKNKKEKEKEGRKVHHKAEGSAHKEKRHHHHKNDKTAPPALLVSTPASAAELDTKARNVTEQLAGLALQPSEKIEYLLAHDPNAQKAAGIFYRTTSGRNLQVLESEGKNANPQEGLLPGHPLVVNQQKLEWVPKSTQEEEKKKKAAEDKKLKPI